MDRNAMFEKAAQLVGTVEDLPTIPAVATQVLHLLDQHDVQVEEVADLMLSDQVMTARVMKLINSPVYRPAQQITSLQRALVYLGLKHVREVVLTTAFINAFGTKAGEIGLATFWGHSFGVGMVSKIIAERLGYPDRDKAYIAGIILDLGEVFLSAHLPQQFRRVMKAIRETPVSLVEAEALLLGTTHCEIGLCMARKWNFPEVYCEVIACHHTPAEGVIDPDLCAIVNLADLFWTVRKTGYGGWTSFDLHQEPAWRILTERRVGLAEIDEERLCYELDDAVPYVEALVDALFTAE